jgi:hypothetical protein
VFNKDPNATDYMLERTAYERACSYTSNEELWGSRAGEGGRHIFYILSLKEILIRRQRNIWDVDYLPLLLLVEVCWICASSHPLVTCLYGTVSSNERKALNKAAL